MMWETLKEENNKKMIQKCGEKQLYRYFKQQTSDMLQEKIWMWLREGSLKRLSDIFLIAGLKNTLGTHYIKTKLDKTKQNTKFSLCCDRE